MKNKYAHIFEPLTVRAMTVKKQNLHDANGNKLWRTEW